MKAHDFILKNIGAKVYITGHGDLAMDGKLRPLIFNKTELTLVKLTKNDMAHLVDDNGKYYSVPPRNVREVERNISYKEKILKLKNELNAIILAHYYQTGDIQDIADFIGDSLELARNAKKTNADVIVFAGVHFMAEAAKILNPDKIVVVPDMAAGCSLADNCPAGEFETFIKQHPNHYVISYINCSAEVKALSDIICTSSNAEAIINTVPKDVPIIFAPDKNLGKYLIKKTGRDMLLWEGSCIVHEHFSEEKIIKLLTENPGAKLIAHPECTDSVLMWANFIGSTSKLLKFVQEDSATKFIVATESGILHQMKKLVPEKEFIAGPPVDDSCSCNECPYMKLNTMEKLYNCMRDLSPRIEVDADLARKALIPIDRMLQIK